MAQPCMYLADYLLLLRKDLQLTFHCERERQKQHRFRTILLLENLLLAI